MTIFKHKWFLKSVFKSSQSVGFKIFVRHVHICLHACDAI